MTRTERQTLGVDKWIKNKCKGTLLWCTGCGKTRASITAISRFFDKNPERKVVIIVPTELLQKQWIKELALNGIIFNIDVKIINSAIMKPFHCDFLVLDEIHRYCSDEFSKIFVVCNPGMILGLTATYERLDDKHSILNKYAPVVDTITVQEATANGWLSPYREYKIMLDVDLTEYNDANAKFQTHFAFFGFDFNLAMKCLKDANLRQRYADFLKCNIGEVNAHTFGFNKALRARKEFVMNHPKKLEIAELILKHRQNKKAITFNATIKQCEKFKIGTVIHSGNTKKKNRLTLDEFREVKEGVLHTSKAANEGVDIKGLNLAIILHNSSSQTDKIQRVGNSNHL